MSIFKSHNVRVRVFVCVLGVQSDSLHLSLTLSAPSPHISQIPVLVGAKDYPDDIDTVVKRLHGIIADLEKEGYAANEIGVCVCVCRVCMPCVYV